MATARTFQKILLWLRLKHFRREYKGNNVSALQLVRIFGGMAAQAQVPTRQHLGLEFLLFRALEPAQVSPSFDSFYGKPTQEMKSMYLAKTCYRSFGALLWCTPRDDLRLI